MGLKNLLVLISAKWLKKPFGSIGNFTLNFVLIKIYKIYLIIKKPVARIYLPARNKLLFPLTHRYFVHFALIIIALLVATVNISAHELGNASFGEKTLLSSLVTPSEEEYVEEKAVEESRPANVASYLGNGLAQSDKTPLTDIETEDLEEDTTPLTQGGAAITTPIIGPGSDLPRTRTNIEEYVVQDGDTISEVAAKFGLSINTVLWANNLTSYGYIRPGQKISIPPVSGVIIKVAKGDTVEKLAAKYGSDVKNIRDWNNLSENALLAVGQQLILPGGQMPRPQPVYSRLSSLQNFVTPPNAGAGGKMLWPTTVRRITQYFTWRHHAVDIAGPVGTPIYAADDGVVELSGWSAGYGNQVLLDHGDRKTRYGHLSKIFVAKGEAVKRGQVIGAMGSTGWSTGPHLHFEVRINGVLYNPLNYIK